MLKSIEQGGEGGGVLLFILCKKIFDEVSFYFIKDFFTQRAVFYFFITFLSIAGGHLDLGKVLFSLVTSVADVTPRSNSMIA